MAGQILDMYIKVTAANLLHYVTNDIINCTSVLARYAVQNGDAIYCDSVGTEIVPAWGPVIINATIENAAAANIVINYDMAMAVTDETGFSVLVDGSPAALHATTPIAVAANAITLTLASAVTAGQDVLLTYDASAGNAENTNVTPDPVAVDTIIKTVVNNVA